MGLKQAQDLADLGFLPVRYGERQKRIMGWLLVYEDTQDPDLQLVFIDHNGKIRLGVLEREMMDYNQSGWLVARDYFINRRLAKWQNNDSLLVGDAPSSRPCDIVEELNKAEFRDHLANPQYQHSRTRLTELLATMCILDAPTGELRKHIQYSTQLIQKTRHSASYEKSRRSLTSGTTTTGVTLRITEPHDPHAHRSDIMRKLLDSRQPHRSA